MSSRVAHVASFPPIWFFHALAYRAKDPKVLRSRVPRGDEPRALWVQGKETSPLHSHVERLSGAGLPLRSRSCLLPCFENVLAYYSFTVKGKEREKKQTQKNGNQKHEGKLAVIQRREPLGELGVGGHGRPQFKTCTSLSSSHGHLPATDAGVFVCETLSFLFHVFLILEQLNWTFSLIFVLKYPSLNCWYTWAAPWSILCLWTIQLTILK